MSRRKKQAQQKSKTGPLIVVTLVIAAVVIGGLVIFRPSTSGSGTALRDSDTAFSISTHIGQPAPRFTAIGVDGQPYTVTPGDGHPKVIVFYMGYG